MSRSLILFRHGKSDWEAGIDVDHERPLARRGVKAAKAMGRMIAEVGQLPDLAISSTAVRAADTLELAARAGGWPTRLTRDRTLYETSPDTMMKLVNQLPEESPFVMLVGHEPTWSELVARLTGGGNLRFPTAAMTRIDFAVDSWRETGPGDGHLAWLIPPRLLTDGNFHL